MSLGQKNKEKSRVWHHSTGRMQVCLSSQQSEPRVPSDDQSPFSATSRANMDTNRIWRPLRHQLLASRGLQSVKDSFKSKARIATTLNPSIGSSLRLCRFCREEKHLVADHTPEGKAQGRGEGACPPHGRRLTSVPRSQHGKFPSYNFPC